MNEQKKFYDYLDDIKEGIIIDLNSFTKSSIIQKYFLLKFKSIVYGNMILFFFNNLEKENVKKIRRKYRYVIKKTKSSLKSKNFNNNISKNYYKKFKSIVIKDFPVYEKIFFKMEKIIDLDKLEKYINKTENDFFIQGKSEDNIFLYLTTKEYELYLKDNKKLPNNKDIKKINDFIINDCTDKLSKINKKSLDKDMKNMLNDKRKDIQEFEKSLLNIWKKPIDLLETLIKISTEYGEMQLNKLKLSKINNEKNKDKYGALIQIHARIIQTANAILVLLKSGYVNDANGRWRTLYELVVIIFFLSEKDNNMSKRYMEYSEVRAYKKAKNYEINCEMLGYKPLGLETLDKMRKCVDFLNKKWGDDFGNIYRNFNWIPKGILKKRNFAELEKYVGLDHIHPYYDMSCDDNHGGASGLYRFGLMDRDQDKILLTGPSMYGLENVLINTSHSILQINTCLSALNPDIESITCLSKYNQHFKSIIITKISKRYYQEIYSETIKTETQIEKEYGDK